ARCWRDPGRLRGRRLPAPWGACVVEPGARGRRGRARADAWSPRRLDRRGARLACLPRARLPVTSSAATHCRLREPTSRSAGCRTSLTEKVGELFGHAGVGRVGAAEEHAEGSPLSAVHVRFALTSAPFTSSSRARSGALPGTRWR